MATPLRHRVKGLFVRLQPCYLCSRKGAHRHINKSMLIAWTTVATAGDAAHLARGAVEARLAACVQIDGPVTSHYRWEGRIESGSEYRLMFKFLPEQAAALEAWVHAQHPYDTPEWIVARAEHVSEKYLSWAGATATSAPARKAPTAD